MIGDKEYAIKCKETYKKMGLVAHAYFVKEAEQPRYVYNLLTKIRPNILVMTGHDAFIRKRNDIYNITLLNPDGKQTGVTSIAVDGEEIVGSYVGLKNDGKEHSVVITM